MNDDLLFKLADILQTDLFHVGSDVRGLIPNHQFKIGNWVVKSDVTIIVDENTDKMVSALARIYGNLWAYIVVTKKGDWLLFFDGSRVKLHVGAEREFGLGNAKNSLKKLKPALTRAFFMAPLDEVVGKAEWKPMSLDVTDFL